MRKKIFFLLFVLCLIKLYDIAGRSLNFSPNLLINSFKEDGGEKISLGITADDVIPMRSFFLSKNIMEFKLSEKIKKNYEIYYLRMMEFYYPIREVKNTTFICLGFWFWMLFGGSCWFLGGLEVGEHPKDSFCQIIVQIRLQDALKYLRWGSIEKTEVV